MAVRARANRRSLARRCSTDLAEEVAPVGRAPRRGPDRAAPRAHRPRRELVRRAPLPARPAAHRRRGVPPRLDDLSSTAEAMARLRLGPPPAHLDPGPDREPIQPGPTYTRVRSPHPPACPRASRSRPPMFSYLSESARLWV